MAVMIRQMIATKDENDILYKPAYFADTDGIALVFEDEEEARAWKQRIWQHWKIKK